MLFIATIRVMRKNKVHNPEAATIHRVLVNLGFIDVVELRMGKEFVVSLEAEDEQAARETVERIGKEVLANSQLEKHEIVSVHPG